MKQRLPSTIDPSMTLHHLKVNIVVGVDTYVDYSGQTFTTTFTFCGRIIALQHYGEFYD